MINDKRQAYNILGSNILQYTYNVLNIIWALYQGFRNRDFIHNFDTMGSKQSLLNYNHTSYNPYAHTATQLDYSKTPNMSCIIPPINGIGGLYLGDLHAASDLPALQALGIKAVLTVARGTNLHYHRSIVSSHLKIEAKDDIYFNLSEYFEQAVGYIKRNLQNTNVLVHCMAGISRSTTLVIAYLMTERGMSYESALAYVTQCRPIVNPNSGFVIQLKQYEMRLPKIIKSRKGSQVLETYSPPSSGFKQSTLGAINNIKMSYGYQTIGNSYGIRQKSH